MKTEWIQGKRALQEVLRSKRQVELIYFVEGIQKGSIRGLLDQIMERNIPYTWVSRKKLDQLSKNGNHQGVMAKVAAYQYASLEDCFAHAKERDEPPFLLLLD